MNDGNKTCSLACNISGQFADPLTRLCVDKCNLTAGYFGNLGDKRCYLRCPSGYGNPVTGQCVSQCPSTPSKTYGDNITARCVYSCPNATYGDPSTRVCMNSQNCGSGLFGDDLTNTCVAQCSALYNMYADPVTKKCVFVC